MNTEYLESIETEHTDDGFVRTLTLSINGLEVDVKVRSDDFRGTAAVLLKLFDDWEVHHLKADREDDTEYTVFEEITEIIPREVDGELVPIEELKKATHEPSPSRSS